MSAIPKLKYKYESQVLNDLLIKAETVRKSNTVEYKNTLDQINEIAENSDDYKIKIQNKFLCADYHWLIGESLLAMNKANDAINIANENNSDHFVAEIYNLIANIEVSLGNYESGLRNAMKSLDLYKKANNENSITSVKMNIGNIYYYLDEYPTALEYYLMAVNYSEENRTYKGSPNAFLNIGNVYYKLGDHENALKNFYISLEKNRELNDKKGEANCLNNIGIYWMEKQEYDKSLTYFFECLEISKMLQSKQTQLVSSYNLALVYINQDKFTESEELLLDALKIATDISDKKNIVEGHYILGELYSNVKIKKYDKAIYHLNQAKEIGENIKVKSLLYKSYSRLSQLHEIEGDYKLSLEEFKNFHNIKEEIFNEESDAKTKKLAVIHKVDNIIRESQDLKRKNSELDILLSEKNILNTELKTANEALQKLNKEKNEFLNIAAHDLKNPLLGIKGVAELLKFDDQLTKDEFQSYIDMIIYSSGNMFEIIKNLLNVNTLEDGLIKVKKTKIDVYQNLQNLLLSYDLIAKKKNIKIEFSNELDSNFIFSDKELVHQVFDNLISNAIKYSKQNSEVSIKLKKYKHPEFYLFEISDSGPGFSERDKLKMFKKFSKLTAQPTAGEQSSGLGLFIVHKLVELLGGKIELEETSISGSKFKLLLPLI